MNWGTRRRRASGLAVGAISVVVAIFGAVPSRAGSQGGIAALAGRARLIVFASVRSVTPHDGGRLTVSELSVRRVLKGRYESKRLAVVELRNPSVGTNSGLGASPDAGPSAPPVAGPAAANHQGLRASTDGVVFLRRASRSSYLREQLPDGEYYELLPGRISIVVADSLVVGDEIAALVQRLLTEARGTGAAAIRDQRWRELTFDLLGVRHPFLVEEGIRRLRAVRSPLAPKETATLAMTLSREELGPRVRIDLIRAMAAADLEEAIPSLKEVDSPAEVMEAAWQALAQFGEPTDDEEVLERLASSEPAVRIVALREILRREGAEAVPLVGPLAVEDAETDVREAALEALATLALPEALPPMERVFAQDDGALRQAAGRAILAVGGPAAAESLARLAFEAPASGQRYAAVLLMTLDTPAKQESLQRLRTGHPNEEVRHLVEHGLPVSGH